MEFEENLRKGLEEKKKKEGEKEEEQPSNGKKYSDLELKVLAKEAEVRTNVGKVLVNFDLALKVPFFFVSCLLS